MGRPKGSTDAPQRLLKASLRGFKGHGYGGVGVDGLASEAGLTSGAFYSHFGSKAEAFRRSVAAGAELLRATIADYQDRFGDEWLPRFVDYYLGQLVDGDAAESCIMPTLTSDVARADSPTRSGYEEGVSAVIKQISSGLRGTKRGERASLVLAMLTGGAAIVRALPDGAAKESFRSTIREEAALIALGKRKRG